VKNRTTWLALSLVAILVMSSPASASVETDIATANAAGRSVFLVVMEGGSNGIDLARRVTSEAQKLATETAIVELNRADPANAATVKKYRLESVPVPLILVLAPNGVAAGGALPHAVTASRLARMVPGPAKAAHLKALDEKKASLLVFARASTTRREDALKAAADAVVLLKGAAVVTYVDLDSKKETDFIAEREIDAKSEVPVTVVFNAKGQATATFLGVQTAGGLAEAALKETQECCPGGRCK